jgi:hypothetical protein
MFSFGGECPRDYEQEEENLRRARQLLYSDGGSIANNFKPGSRVLVEFGLHQTFMNPSTDPVKRKIEATVLNIQDGYIKVKFKQNSMFGKHETTEWIPSEFVTHVLEREDIKTNG